MLESENIEQQKKDYDELEKEIKLLRDQIKRNAKKILNSKLYKNNNFKKFDKKIEECINFLKEEDLWSSHIFVYYTVKGNEVKTRKFQKLFGINHKEILISVNPNFINNIIPDNFGFSKIKNVEEINYLNSYNYELYLNKNFEIYLDSKFKENFFVGNKDVVSLKNVDSIFKKIEINNNSICDNLEEYYKQSIYKEYLEFKKRRNFYCKLRIYRFDKKIRDQINKNKEYFI
jgi:hypothetical protein